LTSVLAIFALLVAKYSGFTQIDPLTGIAGAILVFRWSWGLLRASSLVLLDREGPEDLRRRIRDSIETKDDNRVADLHLWSIGPGIFSAAVSVVTNSPQSPEHYKQLIPSELGVVHVTLEVNTCTDKRAVMQTERGET
jgi:Co/Zn/Cd efflux system component